MAVTKNLGVVKGLHVGTSAPSNTSMLWYDDNTGQKKIKYFDTVAAAWLPLLGNPATHINDPSGGTTIDTQARTAINSILDLLESKGLMAP